LGVGPEGGKQKGGTLYKKGWSDPEPLAVLYSLYRYAEKSERHELTVQELYEGASEGPYTVFGVQREALECILRGLSVSALGNGFIRVDLIRDLDSIFLNPARKASEVLNLG
jgi:phosphoadenosine phosphosulfate reductase